MIIVRISEGLGNQMFQYAFGRALSMSKGTELVLDTSSYFNRSPSEPIRKFALDGFNIRARIATWQDFQNAGIPDPSHKSVPNIISKTALKLIDSRRPTNRKKIILEKDFTYDPEVLNASDDSYFSGVWQSEKYFKDIAPTIREDFTVKNWSKLGSAFKNQIESGTGGTPVSVHVRRGDYVSNPKTNFKHGVLDADYYSRAFDTITKNVEKPIFYIFSDDIEWCRVNLGYFKPAVMVSDPELSYSEEIALMSSCRHHIIANSSFSWWGAWLNPDTHKIVIAPKNWFQTIANTKDLIPETWTRI